MNIVLLGKDAVSLGDLAWVTGPHLPENRNPILFGYAIKNFRNPDRWFAPACLLPTWSSDGCTFHNRRCSSDPDHRDSPRADRTKRLPEISREHRSKGQTSRPTTIMAGPTIGSLPIALKAPLPFRPSDSQRRQMPSLPRGASQDASSVSTIPAQRVLLPHSTFSRQLRPAEALVSSSCRQASRHPFSTSTSGGSNHTAATATSLARLPCCSLRCTMRYIDTAKAPTSLRSQTFRC